MQPLMRYGCHGSIDIIRVKIAKTEQQSGKEKIVSKLRELTLKKLNLLLYFAVHSLTNVPLMEATPL